MGLFLAVPFGYAAGTALDRNGIRSRIVGNSATYYSRDLEPIKAFFAPGGTLRGIYNGKKFRGSRSIKNDQLCADLPGTIDDGCLKVIRRNGDQLQLYTGAAEPASDRLVEQGNSNDY